MITEFFGFGRRSTVIIQQRVVLELVGIFSERLFPKLLISTPLYVDVMQHKHHSPPSSHIVFGEKSFSDVKSSSGHVHRRKEQPVEGNSSSWMILSNISLGKKEKKGVLSSSWKA